MNTDNARLLANELIDKTFVVGGHEVCARKLGFRFGWMNSERTLGQCNYKNKLIRLSKNYVLRNSEELVKDTILHELAHAFNWHIYKGKGHGKSWRFCCVQVGAKPDRCKQVSEGLVLGGHKYVLQHVETKEIFERYHKWPSSTYKNIKNIYIHKRKHETLGKLELVSV
jgi:predicted SprT family Zn-dependent metalloprotease